MPYNVVVDKKLILDSAGGIYLRARNNSGAARTTGEVVIWDTSVTYAAYTTTTSQDDAKVMGVVAEYTPSAVEGLVQVQGYFTGENLFVNGTTDIAAGDFISTFTSAGIAAKATTGKAGSFALALEAYSTNDSAGRIKAILLFPNRQDASATVTYGTAGQMAAPAFAASAAAGTTAAVMRVDAQIVPDFNGLELILDADADTSITADTDDTIDIKLLALDKIQIDGVNNVLDLAVNASNIFRIDLDVDNDTSIRSSADDVIDFEAGGATEFSFDTTKLDLSGNHLDNAGYLVLNAVTLPAGTEVYAGHDNAGDLTLNALSGKAVNLAVAGADDVSLLANSFRLESGTKLRFLGNDSVNDSNDNELVLFSATGSAVNEFTVANAATGNGPVLSATGGDADIDIVLTPKGAGDVVVTNAFGLIVGNAAQITPGELSEVQVLGTAEGTDSSAVLGLWSATDAVEPKFKFLKSGNATIGSFTIVATDEELGGITWYGDDGVDYNAIAAEINVEVDAAPGAGDMPGRMVFATTADGAETPTEVMRLTSGQNVSVASNNKVIIGNTTSVNIGDTSPPKLQVLSTSAPTAGIELGHYAANANPPVLFFGKSRGGTVGAILSVAENDELGQIRFFGSDTTDVLTPGAGISAFVDGTPGANDMPGRIVFSTTADGAASLSEVFRIASDQNLYVANGNGVVVGAAAQYALSNGAGATLTPELEVVGTAPADSSIGLLAASADAVGPYITLAKSRNAALGSFTIIQDADVLGNLVFAGDDGVDYMATAALIRGEVDGTPGAGDMPGALRFMTTADGAESPTSRMYINAAGAVFIGSTDVTTFTGSGGSLVFDEIVAPAGTATNQAQIYAYDSATVTTMAQQKSDGTNADL